MPYLNPVSVPSPLRTFRSIGCRAAHCLKSRCLHGNYWNCGLGRPRGHLSDLTTGAASPLAQAFHLVLHLAGFRVLAYLLLERSWLLPRRATAGSDVLTDGTPLLHDGTRFWYVVFCPASSFFLATLLRTFSLLVARGRGQVRTKLCLPLCMLIRFRVLRSPLGP